MRTIDDTLIQEMTRTIVEKVSPRKVVLFGSYVSGHPRKDSDVDLLIIEDEPFGKLHPRIKEIASIRRALSQFRVPTDILLYSADEATKWQDSLNHILARCLREGKVLYERH